ncbi:MAG TPA: hypothetical protein VK750_05920, partial [Cytophagaceae bacterium]|nr:hypothetical protein [Cytophagaceae bacterium]
MLQIISNHTDAFTQAKTISKIGNYLLLSSTVVAIFTTYSGSICITLAAANDFLNNLNIVLILLYILFELIVNSLLPKAELRRRLGYLDNSFGTNFTGKQSENYYNNENLKHGLIKLAANCFESCFFTFNISRRMIMPLAIKNIMIIIAFLAAAYFGEKKFLILLSQLTLPVVLVQQLLKLVI